MSQVGLWRVLEASVVSTPGGDWTARKLQERNYNGQVQLLFSSNIFNFVNPFVTMFIFHIFDFLDFIVMLFNYIHVFNLCFELHALSFEHY